MTARWFILTMAATTQKPECVIQTLDRYYREQNANVHRAAHFLSAKATHAYENSREQVKTFINARYREEIIWTRGATEAINLIAQSWGRSQLNKGDEILLTQWSTMPILFRGKCWLTRQELSSGSLI